MDNYISATRKLLLLLFFISFSHMSAAVCVQANLAGIWYLNGFSGDTLESSFLETDFCKIKINASGSILGNASSCKARVPEGVFTVNLTGGNLNLNAGCRITGRINYCDPELQQCGFAIRIDQAQLDRGKTVMSISGFDSTDTEAVVHFVGIKR
ncbi:hypothetical protein G8764_19990 [Pseudomaricurvus alcaniphilus]|uniref:hypothetical protein n=1 Tax=Pseudomaricurvus alcaniphilus TaxID=1166482 RepID=UPI001409F983|nr:hypothetical protein [Pseudomaricurvus alcaniphilus]NHN39588.1 hypothetical protein [Pseudomaricurvus alcaniphilus]